MATPYPYPDGLDRRRTGERIWRTMFNVVAFGAIAGAPVATVSLWLLLTHPTLASEVADSESLLPIARVLLVSLGKAIAAVLAMM